MTASPRTYLYGIIIFTFFIVGGVYILSELTTQNPSVTNSTKYAQFNSSFNKLEDVSSNVGELEEGLTGSETDFGAFGALNALISSAWQSLVLMFTSFDFMNDVFNGLTSVFGVPAWIPTLVILLVTVMLVFAIYSAIFQKEL